jgi:transcriptional regulator with XRE-family HTH domain
MKLSEWFDQKIRELEGDFEFRLEKLMYGLTEKIYQKMEDNKLNRVKLAKNMNVSSAYVTKILRGNSNLTVKSLLRLADALDQELIVSFESRPRYKNVIAFKSPALRDYTDSSTSFLRPGVACLATTQTSTWRSSGEQGMAAVSGGM